MNDNKKKYNHYLTIKMIIKSIDLLLDRLAELDYYDGDIIQNFENADRVRITKQFLDNFLNPKLNELENIIRVGHKVKEIKPMKADKSE